LQKIEKSLQKKKTMEYFQMKCFGLGSNIKTKITKMQKKYCEEYEACNIAGAPPSSWSWYEHFHSILGDTKKK
jgi:hypothetical protein